MQKKTKQWLILFFAVVCLHLSMASSKVYFIDMYSWRINPYGPGTSVHIKKDNLTEKQYDEYCKGWRDKTKVYSHTRVKYLYFLPEWSIHFIYLFYFISIAGLIFTWNQPQNSNEK